MVKICQMHPQSKTSENSSSHPCDRVKCAPYRIRSGAAALAVYLLSLLIPGACHAQSRNVLCRAGAGFFEAEFPPGVKVHVGASRIGELENRVCEAALSWSDQNLVVSNGASDLDIDAFGVDLGLSTPVAAFQVRKSKAECCMEYKIYSLRAPPALLHSITGGEFFSAADTDLDGRVEIWTNDAAAVEGFENFRLRDLDFAPPIVLRSSRSRSCRRARRGTACSRRRGLAGCCSGRGTGDHLLALVLAQEAVVDKHPLQLIADRLVQRHSDDAGAQHPERPQTILPLPTCTRTCAIARSPNVPTYAKSRPCRDRAMSVLKRSYWHRQNFQA